MRNHIRTVPRSTRVVSRALAPRPYPPIQVALGRFATGTGAGPTHAGALSGEAPLPRCA
jgi:hypothetical protein